MHVKVFEADSVKEAMEQVKHTLGPDALILSTRTIPDSQLGVLGKTRHEVTAAMDGPGHNTPGQGTFIPRATRSPRKPQQKKPGRGGAVPRDIRAVEEAFARQKEFLTATLLELQKEVETHQADALKHEMAELKKMVQKAMQTPGQQFLSATLPIPLNDCTTNKAPHPVWPAPQNQHGGTKKGIASPARPRTSAPVALFQPMIDIMKRNDLSPAVAKRLVMLAHRKLTIAAASTPETQKQFLKLNLQPLLSTTGSLVTPGYGKKRIALVGPAGVGKTTTLAKMSANYIQSRGTSAALISIDTYCIGATEQVRQYGAIMKLPVEVVSSPDQLAVALATHRDKEIVFIDIAGRSPKDEAGLKELKAFFAPEFGIDIHLALSAATAERNMREIIKKFSFLHPKSHIFTKLDECDTIGSVININVDTKMPISYLTDGQKVPEDIHIATQERLASLATIYDRN